MKNMIKFFMVITIIMLFTGCTNQPIMQSAKILIPDSMYDEGYIYEITTDGTIKVSSGNILSWDDENNYNLEYKTKQLSILQRKKVNELITKVKENKEPIKEEPAIEDSITVLALIDGVQYCSRFSSLEEKELYNHDIDQNVVNLAVKLIKISPFKAKGLTTVIKIEGM